MPLSEREQKLLEEMERNLYHNEADVLSTSGGAKRAPNYTAIASGVVLGVIGIGVMLTGVGLGITLLGVVGFGVLFAGVMIAVAVPGSPVQPGPAGSSRSGLASRGSLMEQLNERWERRQHGENP